MNRTQQEYLYIKCKICFTTDCGGTSVKNGQVHILTGTEYNDVADVSCNDGYKINGTGTITCLGTKQWSKDTECVLKGRTNSLTFKDLYNRWFYSLCPDFGLFDEDISSPRLLDKSNEGR